MKPLGSSIYAIALLANIIVDRKGSLVQTEASVMDKKSFVTEKSVNVLKTFLYLSLIF